MFAHIPKCGGNSAHYAIMNSLAPDETEYEYLCHRILKHEQPDKFSGHFKFAVVRDPVKRLVSLYFYQCSRIQTLTEKGSINEFEGGHFAQLNKLYEQYGICDIHAFLNKFPEFYRNEIQPVVNNIEELNRTVTMRYFHKVGFLPQHLFICGDDGKILVDEVVDQESLNVFLGERFNINVEEAVVCNTHGHTNDDYLSYVEPRHLEAIRSIYAKDYEIFGF